MQYHTGCLLKGCISKNLNFTIHLKLEIVLLAEAKVNKYLLSSTNMFIFCKIPQQRVKFRKIKATEFGHAGLIPNTHDAMKIHVYNTIKKQAEFGSTKQPFSPLHVSKTTFKQNV